VQYVNKTYHRSGTLWEGRFKSSLVQRQGYMLTCQRYIELNPVRAGMVSLPDTYPWSSFAGNTGARTDPFLTAHDEYVALGSTDESRALAYAGLLAGSDDAEALSAIREATESGIPLVGKELRSHLEAQGARLERAQPGPRSSAEDLPMSNQLGLLTE
jgi:putative transposase